jgi:hypothetical protein
MDDVTKIAVTSVASLAGGYALKFVQPRSKVVWWSPHAFWFNLNPQTNTGVYTHALTIQNVGRKAVSDIEIAHRSKPELFKLNPSLDFVERTTPDGQHIICIASIARKEWFSIEFLSANQIPELLYIRTKDGHCQRIQIQPQRIFPRWYLGLLQILILVGFGFSLYWLIRAVYFISENF